MSEEFKRIQVSNNTDVLIRAMDLADDCDFILVLYQGKEGSKVGQGFLNVGEPNLAELNWYIDRFKHWLLGSLRKDGE